MCVCVCALSRGFIWFLISYVSKVFGEDFNRTVSKEHTQKCEVKYVCISACHFLWSASSDFSVIWVLRFSKRPEMHLSSSGLWCDVTGYSFFLEPYTREYKDTRFLRNVVVLLLRDVALYRKRTECVSVMCIRGVQIDSGNFVAAATFVNCISNSMQQESFFES